MGVVGKRGGAAAETVRQACAPRAPTSTPPKRTALKKTPGAESLTWLHFEIADYWPLAGAVESDHV